MQAIPRSEKRKVNELTLINQVLFHRSSVLSLLTEAYKMAESGYFCCDSGVGGGLCSVREIFKKDVRVEIMQGKIVVDTAVHL